MLEKFLEVLTRIAVAAEKIAAQGNGSAQAVPEAVVAKPATRTTKVQPVKQVTAVAEPEVDPFAQEVEQDVEQGVSFDSLTELLKTHAKQLGTKTTVALIVKHGANRLIPKMNTIPEANYKACYDEATADLKKLEKKA